MTGVPAPQHRERGRETETYKVPGLISQIPAISQEGASLAIVLTPLYR